MRDKATIRRETLYIIHFAVASRILIFIKDILTASKIGVNYKMDSYILALSTIMLVTNLIAEGIIVATIPLLQEIEGKYGKDRRIDYTNNLLTVIFIGALILIIIGLIFAPFIIKIFAPGFRQMELEKTILLFRIGLPIIVVSWIRAIGAGALQAEHAFRAGAKGGISYSLVFIMYFIFFADDFGIKGLMLTSIVAILSQAYLLFKAMKTRGFKYKWGLDLKDVYLMKFARYLLPIIAGVGINELNNSIDNAIASTLPPGSIAELNYANEIINLFLGLFITAIVTVIFPVLSENFNNRECDDLNRWINRSIKTLFTISIPVAIILMSMAEPIVKLVFERGAFDAEAAFFTSEALAYYSLGLPSMVLIPLITRIYYSIQDMKTPLKISILALAVNIIIDLSLAPYMGARGVALGTSASIILASGIGFYDLNKRLGLSKGKDIRKRIYKFLFATIIMTTGIILSHGLVVNIFNNLLLSNLITVGFASIIGIGLFFGILWILKV